MVLPRLPLSQVGGLEPVGVEHRVCRSLQAQICIRDRSRERISRISTRRSELGLVLKDGKMEVLKYFIEKYALGNTRKPLPNIG